MEELINRVRIGDQDAFRELMESNSDFAFRIAFRIIPDEETAKDIVQESFLMVWNKIKTFQKNGKFTSWLYKIIVNKCYDELRKKKRYSTEEMDESWLVNPEGNPEREI